MELLYKGPAIIVAKFGEHTFELRDAKNEKLLGKWHKQLLRPYKKPSGTPDL